MTRLAPDASSVLGGGGSLALAGRGAGSRLPAPGVGRPIAIGVATMASAIATDVRYVEDVDCPALAARLRPAARRDAATGTVETRMSLTMERIAPWSPPGVSIEHDELCPVERCACEDPRWFQLGGRRADRPRRCAARYHRGRGLGAGPASAAAASATTRALAQARPRPRVTTRSVLASAQRTPARAGVSARPRHGAVMRWVWRQGGPPGSG